MTQMLFLLPIALAMGFLGLLAFFWSLRSGQFDDLEGDAQRILFDDEEAEEDGAPAGDGIGVR
jgi:cbb3-type cytochrome oxidase maturation protein